MAAGCYTFSDVGYVNLGRKLGIGTRIAAKMLRERTQGGPAVAAGASSGTAGKPVPQRAPAPQVKTAQQTDARTTTRNVTRGLAQGSKGFGRGFWQPFARAIRALWHEVTGVFFGIFALFFAQNMWRVRGAWKSGAEHRHFEVYLIFLLVFGYFSVAAFASSRRSSQ